MRPSRLPVTCPNGPVVAVQLRTHLVPLSMIEGVVHVCAKLDVQAFVNSNILSERNIPIVLPGSSHDAWGGRALHVIWRHDKRAGVEILSESAIGVGEVWIPQHIQISESVKRAHNRWLGYRLRYKRSARRPIPE